MFNIILDNLMILVYPVEAFILCWFANFVSSIYYNVGIVYELFDLKKLGDGIIKMISVALTLISLSAGVIILTEYCKEIQDVMNITILDADSIDKINIMSIVLLFAKSTLGYGKQALITVSNIFNFKLKEKE